VFLALSAISLAVMNKNVTIKTISMSKAVSTKHRVFYGQSFHHPKGSVNRESVEVNNNISKMNIKSVVKQYLQLIIAMRAFTHFSCFFLKKTLPCSGY
jgi:hypothetical protein